MTKRERRPVGVRARARCAPWLLVALSALVPVIPARAEPSSFAVPEQNLGAALRKIAEHAQVQVLFTPEQIAGRRSRAVRGRYEPIDALRAAIRGSGLDVTAVADDAFVVSRAEAKSPAAPTPTGASEQVSTPVLLDEMIVTGRRGREPLRKADTAFAVTVVGNSRLETLAPSGMAEILDLTPGFWVEPSGGEASNNVRARGVPLDGYASIAVLEDGLPVQHDAGLAFLNPDQVLRPSIGIDRVEILRGGPAAIVASQAPGGVLNAISRPAPDHPKAELRFGGATAGQTRRVELWAGAPVAGWRVAVDGFWREGRGARGAGFDADRGGQVRFAAVRDWAGGEAAIDVKVIDDRVAFFLPVPLQLRADGTIGEAPDFDARRGTLIGPDLLGFDPAEIQDANAPAFRIDDGTHVRLAQITARTHITLSNDWRLEFAARHRDSQTARNGLFPRSPTTANARLEGARALAPNSARLSYRVARTGGAWTGGGDDLVIEALASSVAAPLDETLASARLDGAFSAFGGRHALALGLYAARSDAQFHRTASMILMEARPNGRRLDIVALDANGERQTALTDGGVVRYGAQWDSVTGRQTAGAGFATFESTFGAVTLDAGLRLEAENLEGARVRAAPVNLGGATSADDAVLRGTGERITFDARFDAVNGTLGARAALDPSLSVFARVTQATRLPSLSAFYGEVIGAGSRPTPTRSIDIGVSLARRSIAVSAVAFRTRFSGFPFDETVIDPASGAVASRVAFAGSETLGLEVETDARLFGTLRLDSSFTLQEPEFRSFRAASIIDGAVVQRDFSGNQLVRVPRIMARVAPTVSLPNGGGEIGLSVEHFGARYADAANTVRLPAYTTLGAHARFELAPGLSLTLVGANLTDTLGLTEGNPRSGQIASTDAKAALFTARPIFGRSMRATLTMKF